MQYIFINHLMYYSIEQISPLELSLLILFYLNSISHIALLLNVGNDSLELNHKQKHCLHLRIVWHY